MKKSTKIAFLSTGLFVLSLVIVIGYFTFQFLFQAAGKENEEVIFEVAPGQSLTTVAKNLQDQNLIKNAQLFLFYSRAKNQSKALKVGEYSLRRNMTPNEVLAAITSGKSILRSLTFSEGLNIYDLASIIELSNLAPKEVFFKLIRDPNFITSVLGIDARANNITSLEGYLFPDTYRFTKYESLESIVRNMVAHFLKVYSDIEPQQQQMGWTRHQVVTLASIIEKETGAGWERPLISSVFHNRLQKKMRLQTDPTIIYSLALDRGEIPRNITREDIRRPHPYNTYTVSGLPPGPIANPGREALLAAVQPKPSNFLFFVSQNDGTHIFSETYQQHEKAVQEYQVNPKARQNKSWRDLNKSSPANPTSEEKISGEAGSPSAQSPTKKDKSKR